MRWVTTITAWNWGWASVPGRRPGVLAAMQRAEKNIDELLDGLNGEFHRLRQSSIDEELFDVISGFEALPTGKAHRNAGLT